MFKFIDSLTRFFPKVNLRARKYYFRVFRINSFLLKKKAQDSDFPAEFLFQVSANKKFILIDGQCLQSSSYNRGIGRYSRKILVELARSNPNHEFALLINLFKDTRNVRNFLEEISPQVSNIFIFMPNHEFFLNEMSLSEIEKNYSEEIAKLDPDVVLILSIFENPSDVIRYDVSKLSNCFAIFYDVIPLEYPEWFLGIEEVRNEYLHNLDRLKQISQIFSISKTSSSKLIEIAQYEGRIETVGGAGFTEGPPSEGRKLADRRGILSVTSGLPHKNVSNLIRAYALLPKALQMQHNLTLVGVHGTAEILKFRQMAKELGCTVTFLDLIPDNELSNLYALSRVSVSPSLSEGLGMPIFESWDQGCVALGSSGTSLAEILNDGEVTFDPNSFSDLSELLILYLTDDERWENEQKRILSEREKHKWSLVADRVADRLFVRD